MFFVNGTATAEIYTRSLHDALPISELYLIDRAVMDLSPAAALGISLGSLVMGLAVYEGLCRSPLGRNETADRKSTRLNSSHANISYAALCLKKITRMVCRTNSPRGT